jgi:hypothetical protein
MNAVRAWMDRFADYVATKREMADALRAVIVAGSLKPPVPARPSAGGSVCHRVPSYVLCAPPIPLRNSGR